MTLLGTFASMLTPAEGTAPDAIEADIRQELLAHIEMLAEDNVASGMEPELARRNAEQRFGDIDRIERACRAHRNRGQLMLQRINIGVTVILGITVMGLFFQNHYLQQAQRQELRYGMFSQPRWMDRMVRPTQVEFIEIGVGDEIEVHEKSGEWEPYNVTVARDGKLLLRHVGWVHIAGLSRQEAEEVVTKTCSQYFQDVDVKLVVLEPKLPRAL